MYFFSLAFPQALPFHQQPSALLFPSNLAFWLFLLPHLSWQMAPISLPPMFKKKNCGLTYLLHALQGLLQELKLLVLGEVFFCSEKLFFFLFQQLYLIPIGVQLPTETVILFFKGIGLSSQGWGTNRRSSGELPSCFDGGGLLWERGVSPTF